MPEKFDLTYIGEDNQKHRPVMIHRAIFGSFERFMALLIEHYGGNFPTWLTPVQARVVTVGGAHRDYGRQVTEYLKARGIRADLDDRNEKIGYKIREAQLQKVAYMLVVGDNEMADGTVAVRKRGVGDLGVRPYPTFADDLLGEIRDRR
jgi:threonyl-tRNA synthetase